MIVPGVFREDELGASNARGRMIDKLHLTSHSDHRIRRDTIRCDIGARDLLAKKADHSCVYRRHRGPQQCQQPVAVERR
jgi:hypothetical protein